MGKTARLETLVGVTGDGKDLVDLITRIHGVNVELTLVWESFDEKVHNLEVDYAAKYE